MLKELRTRQEMIDAYRAARARIRKAGLPPKPPLPPRPPKPPPPPPPPAAASRPALPDHFSGRFWRVGKVVLIVAEHFQIDAALLVSPDRRKQLILPRFIAIYLARAVCNLSTTQIGVAFDRDHTSIMHALARIEGAIRQGGEVAELITILDARITERMKGRPRWQADT